MIDGVKLKIAPSVKRRKSVEVNYKKTILMTAGITLLSLLVSALIMFLLLFFVFTKDLARFTYKLGNYSFASTLYSRVYEKDGNISDCYLALTLDIRTDDYKGVIKNYELFVSDENYLSFMQNVSKSSMLASGGLLEKSALTNEENYLEDKYVASLIKVGEENKAFDRAVESFSDYKTYTFERQGHYSLNRFLGDNLARFNVVYNGYENKLIDEMQNYFDDTTELFEAHKADTEFMSKAYLVALGNRLIMVGQNINRVYLGLGISSDKVAINNQNLVKINDTIKGLIQ